METTTIKTTSELENISNEIDDLIGLMVFGEGRNGKYIQVLQSLNNRLGSEINNLNS